MSVDGPNNGVNAKPKKKKSFAVRDHRHKAWYWADNVVIDDYAASLGIYALGVYHLLARRADNETQDCYPSVPHIAEKLRISDPKVREAIKILEAHNMIVVERNRPDEETGGQTSNLYTLLPVSKWKRPMPVPESKRKGIGGAPLKKGDPPNSELGPPQPELPPPYLGDNSQLPKQDNRQDSLVKTHNNGVAAPVVEAATAPVVKQSESVEALIRKLGLPPELARYYATHSEAGVQVVKAQGKENPPGWFRSAMDSIIAKKESSQPAAAASVPTTYHQAYTLYSDMSHEQQQQVLETAGIDYSHEEFIEAVKDVMESKV